ncbi:aminotransferase class I/II-fold pyridoxal phosphate-dependent enzyme [Cupriavidus consociatus]|uniref:aminotransferase class I/II-fold pyridoxal phosphate-dependent enzyme n=1 Tax=Cupriavidus consociatus TaxID=2821357 RepID=UPI001AE9349F|nr:MULTISPECIES: aminotransferase class I/II-fold pyridoxal phosphate-dependent enzyme [unclassified Cupriavidus]MBP0622389.1 aminotransferase class I/II-fold pyridoxal phosphate-dependent enzyme [Cupriavidus sp. LEh25]MDK2659076.1 aminotransferase class I/II-fold pyridoxal phosphate-dependent enzyme [Cupriavidus sp. LEh21]
MSQSIVSSRMALIKPSPSVAAKSMVDDMRAQGHDILDFTIGEPDLPTPAHIGQAANSAIARGETKYTNTLGTLALRKAISAKLKRSMKLDYATDEVVVGCGAKQVIFSALTASLEEGDEVIISAPHWVSYPDMVVLNGGKPVIVVCGPEAGFKLTAAALEAAITPRTRWLIVNSPNNPTGAVYTEGELQELCGVLERHPHVWLMSDEIYEPFVYDGGVARSPIALMPSLKQRSLLINGMSKAYAMTGWRVGYGAGPKDLVKAISTLFSQSSTCTSSVSQAAAVTALESDQGCVDEMVSIFEKRRDRLAELLNEIPGIECKPSAGAFYLYASVKGLLGKQTDTGEVIESDLDVVMFFLSKAGVAVLDGAAYGLSPYLRFSFATSMEVIEEGCERLKRAVSTLR